MSGFVGWSIISSFENEKFVLFVIISTVLAMQDHALTASTELASAFWGFYWASIRIIDI